MLMQTLLAQILDEGSTTGDTDPRLRITTVTGERITGEFDSVGDDFIGIGVENIRYVALQHIVSIEELE